MPKSTVEKSLKVLTASARGYLDELNAIGQDIECRFLHGLDRAWRLGKVLNEIKGVVGHGNWLVWLEANLSISQRHAQRHMELDAANPKAKRVEDLSSDSVRKFRLGYVPDKERAQLPGDAALPPACHHLTLLHDFKRFTRRVDIGQAVLDPEEARRDLQPLYDWLRTLYGESEK